jgi:ATP-dependent RNA helicase RhlE
LESFDELGLIEPLMRAIAHEGYLSPTPIQAQTIPSALTGQDCLGIAQTGTGKTAAFAIPILDRLQRQGTRAEKGRPLALVLAPTRELAIQIADSFNAYGRHLPLRVACVYGGVSQVPQVEKLRNGVEILIATPGRLLDLMNQGFIALHQLQVFVLDEADRMLDMGFLPDLKRIIATLPRRRQSLFFSATMPHEIVALTQQLLNDPVTVNVTPKTVSAQRVEQQLLYVERGERHEILRQLLQLEEVERAIVFTRTKRGASTVGQRLLRAGVKAAVIHGDKSQGARQDALESFRSKRVRVLVATDIAARGIDVDGISHVINFDLPVDAESYVHRIGRTGRAGADGIALSFCTRDEFETLAAIEKLLGKRIPPINTPPEGDWPEPAPNRSGSQGRQGQAGQRGRSGGSRTRSGGTKASSSGASGRPKQSSSSRRSGTSSRGGRSGASASGRTSARG